MASFFSGNPGDKFFFYHVHDFLVFFFVSDNQVFAVQPAGYFKRKIIAPNLDHIVAVGEDFAKTGHLRLSEYRKGINKRSINHICQFVHMLGVLPAIFSFFDYKTTPQFSPFISKTSGNYETIYFASHSPIFYLF